MNTLICSVSAPPKIENTVFRAALYNSIKIKKVEMNTLICSGTLLSTRQRPPTIQNTVFRAALYNRKISTIFEMNTQTENLGEFGPPTPRKQ